MKTTELCALVGVTEYTIEVDYKRRRRVHTLRMSDLADVKIGAVVTVEDWEYDRTRSPEQMDDIVRDSLLRHIAKRLELNPHLNFEPETVRAIRGELKCTPSEPPDPSEATEAK